MPTRGTIGHSGSSFTADDMRWDTARFRSEEHVIDNIADPRQSMTSVRLAKKEAFLVWTDAFCRRNAQRKEDILLVSDRGEALYDTAKAGIEFACSIEQGKEIWVMVKGLDFEGQLID